MNKLVEMKNKIIEIYQDGMISYLKKEDFEELEEEEELDLHTYMSDEIMMLPEDELDDFLSMLALYYYTVIVYSLSDEEEFQELVDINDINHDRVIRSMILNSKEKFLNRLKRLENGLLDQIIDFIIEEDILTYTYNELKNGLTEFDSWYKVEELLKDKRHQQMFKKFHPNLEAEKEEYTKYCKNEKLLEKLINYDIKSVSEFLTIFAQSKLMFSNEDYVRYFLLQYVRKATDKRSKSLPDIMIFALKYYYVEDYLHNPERFETTKREITYALEDLEFYNTSRLSNILIKFLNFDFMKFTKDFAGLPASVISEMNNLITMENRKTYGTEGIWKKHNIKQELETVIENTCVQCPEWESYLSNADDENLGTYIYYSKDKDGEYTVPRVLLTVNDKNEVTDLVGRSENGNIEFSMIPIIRDIANDFSNKDKINASLDFLDLVKAIDEKIEKQEDLTNKEIDLLYNLTSSNSEFYQEFDDLLETVRKKDNTKKSLAQYFRCKEEQVATNIEEIDENTLVTTVFIVGGISVENSNIQVIIGDANCMPILDARGLSSLRIITGSAHFPLLNSSKGLENLIYIGKNADFRNLEDPENLNPDLFIGGTVRFKDDKKTKTYKNKNQNNNNNNN